MNHLVPLAKRISEEDLLKNILELAQICGWRTAHFRTARTAHGWRTPVAGDGEGWPDLLMVRGDKMIVAELKSQKGKLTKEQETWLDAFRQIFVVSVFVWRPIDWICGEIESFLL